MSIKVHWIFLFALAVSGLGPRAFPDILDGADTVTDLLAPVFAGGGGFSTSLGGASASAINPAAGGEAQRAVFEAGYMTVVSFDPDKPVFPFGDPDKKGFGNAANIGVLLPTKFASFSGSINSLDIPEGINIGGNLSAGKELYPRINMGLGLNFGLGGGTSGWIFSGDLGFRYNMGGFGVFENFTTAAVIKGLGKAALSSAFTPVVGVSADLFNLRRPGGSASILKATGALDLSFPGFRNAAGKLGLSLLFLDVVSVAGSWSLNARDLSEGEGARIPSLGLGVNIAFNFGEDRTIAGKLPPSGDVKTTAAAKPLYEDKSYAIGGGITWYVGIMDNKAPVITVDYPETQWLSPNHDGLVDNLEVPIRITDDRIVTGWTMEIQNGTGETVRTYRNKEIRQETQSLDDFFDDFFARLIAVKSGVKIPETFVWDGVSDSGETASDGLYYFSISADDDNGNSAKTGESYEVIIDNTPPAAVIENIDESQRIFSPDGDGNKETIKIGQTGSVEDFWAAGIYNADGDMIKTFNYAYTKPEPVIWDGKDDGGSIVPDGIYEYRLSATDQAKNTTLAVLPRIVISTVQPVVNLQISDAYFSPNGDGIKEVVTFDPVVPTTDGIIGWELQVIDSKVNPCMTMTGTARNLPKAFNFTGKNDAGLPLPEGDYYGKLLVKYRNGYTAEAYSPDFTLDITPPQALISAEYSAFSPNNDGKLDEMLFRQDGSVEPLWVGEVRPAARPNQKVRTFRMPAGTPASLMTWDGYNDAGALVADGEYIYVIFATDPAGNLGRSNEERFTLSTADTPVLLSADQRVFSPVSRGSNNRINLIPQLQVKEGVVSWTMNILNEAGSAVRTITANGAVPAAIPWDGKTSGGQIAPDGTYTAGIELRYNMGNQPRSFSRPFTVDTQPPKAEIAASYNIFSPNDDLRRDTLPIAVTAEGNDNWQLTVKGPTGNVLRTWNWTGQTPVIPWDGKDEAGNQAPDGRYSISLNSTDEAGNSFSKTLDNITLDARTPRVILTASESGIAPLPGENRSVRLGTILTITDSIESWKLDIESQEGEVIRTFTGGPSSAPPGSISWDGLDSNGAVREGRYTPVLTVAYAKGDMVKTFASSILVDIHGPELGFSSSPEYFSPDNDGVADDIFMELSARDESPIAGWSLEVWEAAIDSQGRETSRKSFYRIEGKGPPPEKEVWNGLSSKRELVQAATDYPVTFRVEDELGNASSLEGKIGVDVLVIRDGDRLKIQVPSIIFRANAADFNGLEPVVSDNNYRILKRVAEILNKFRDYKITVEGHANPTTPPGTDARIREEDGGAGEIGLRPLSESRAKATVDFLTGYGVSRNRMSSEGKGGAQTVSSFEDRDNWWKNRRVEFILIK
ncbi:MAG: OmpA family protein [Treponema sp.]|jgi:flagellar hook assembly protein FlgD/outer membrane protein OmpA-like peptidoglycan-associated protein|nr:OmpA family protein [Treponema sp.]